MSIGDGKTAVAIGGGTGLPAVLTCLLDLGYETSAVVTMADDGGSSGALRRDMGILPPGDVRNCLVAMAKEPDGLAARMFQYRFPHGEGLAGHALGNLILAALTDISGGFPAAVEAAEQYLGVRGRVLPSTLADVRLHGVDRQGNEVIGQASLATSPAPVQRAFLEPSRPPAYEPALDAIRNADVIVIGPGSLYTSLIPNLLVAGVSESVCESSARCVYVCNVANMRGETGGFDAADHVQALLDHGLKGCLDVALIHDPGANALAAGVDPVDGGACALERIADMGIAVHSARLADEIEPLHHDRTQLSRALAEVLA